VQDVFKELLQQHQAPTSIVSGDMCAESIPLARRILKDLETRIEGLNTAFSQACIPQGEEVVGW